MAEKTERELEYAVELDDRRVISYVLMRKSNIATDAGQPGHGLGLANAALKQDQQLTPRLRRTGNHSREPPVHAPDGGRVPSGHGSIPFDHHGAPCADRLQALPH